MKPTAALLFSQDTSFAFTKTTEVLARACSTLGVPAYVRDSFDARAIWAVLEDVADGNPGAVRAAEEMIAETLSQLMDDAGVDCIIGLDLCWLFLPDLMVEHSGIKRIYSIWFDDFHSWLGAPTNRIFPARRHTHREILAHPRVRHCFYGEAMAHEAALFGYTNQVQSKLAAPRDYLDRTYPCTRRNKLAFLGNPGSRIPPSPAAIEAMDRGADLAELRNIARAEVLQTFHSGLFTWAQGIEGVIDLLAAATAAKCASPHISALQILQLCLPASPEAFEELNRKGGIYELAMVVKLVCRYDRPALVRRLYKADLCDVYSNPSEWSPYGVQAADTVMVDRLPEVYSSYFAHVNAANPLRDAPANEKLFEIAACGRTSINLWSPDVASCYDEGEVCFVRSLEEAESRARDLLREPDRALSLGKRARLRTAREHTWEHRLSALWALDPIWPKAPADSQLCDSSNQ